MAVLLKAMLFQEKVTLQVQFKLLSHLAVKTHLNWETILPVLWLLVVVFFFPCKLPAALVAAF